MTSIEQALTKLEKVILEGEQKLTYVSAAIGKADELISRSAFKYKPLIVEYYEDDEGKHSLALDRINGKSEIRLFYECYDFKANEPRLYKPLAEAKAHIRAKMIEHLPDFLERFMQLPYKDQDGQ